MTKTRKVYPVEGFFLNDQPHVPHDCDRDLCVDSGAFTTKPPPKEADPKPQDPPDGGSSDSTEE
jgi:hypothetical protein